MRRGERRGVERSGEEWRRVERSGEEWRGVERNGEELVPLRFPSPFFPHLLTPSLHSPPSRPFPPPPERYPQLGGRYALDGGLTFSFDAYESQGGGYFDVDAYHLEIADLLDLEIKLRVAHPLLQTPHDAQAHINVQFLQVLGTPEVHGIVGQTYRDGREKRTVTFAELAELTGRPIAADGEEGKGFLDGDVIDYTTSGVLRADCRYTAFSGERRPHTAADIPPRRAVAGGPAAVGGRRDAGPPASLATTATTAPAAKPSNHQRPVPQQLAAAALHQDARAGAVAATHSIPDRRSSPKQPAVSPTIQRAAAAAAAANAATAAAGSAAVVVASPSAPKGCAAGGTLPIAKPAAAGASTGAAAAGAGAAAGAAGVAGVAAEDTTVRRAPAAKSVVVEKRVGNVLRIPGSAGQPGKKAAGLIGVGGSSVVTLQERGSPPRQEEVEDEEAEWQRPTRIEGDPVVRDNVETTEVVTEAPESSNSVALKRRRYTQTTIGFASGTPLMRPPPPPPPKVTPAPSPLKLTAAERAEAKFLEAQRNYITKWLPQFDWLLLDKGEDGLPCLRCSVCSEHGPDNARYGRNGCGGRDLQPVSMRAHQASTRHEECIERQQGLLDKLAAQKKIDDYERADPEGARVIRLMRSIQFVCDEDAPISMYPRLVEFLAREGVSDIPLQTYGVYITE
ncbi:unnamed protein product [Closterium sp. Yama58-4]|nr:unnamed protein product [Closterium sp. Yama58-4]